jgi:hypothetical protein
MELRGQLRQAVHDAGVPEVDPVKIADRHGAAL